MKTKVSNQARLTGLNAESLEKLATVAKGASVALGRDFADSFERLVLGVTKQERENLLLVSSIKDNLLKGTIKNAQEFKHTPRCACGALASSAVWVSSHWQCACCGRVLASCCEGAPGP